MGESRSQPRQSSPRAKSTERSWGAEVERTCIEDELFLDDFGTSWLVKSERTPTRNVARMVVAKLDGERYIDYGCRTIRARIERRDGGWWLTPDPDGPYEVWEVYTR